MKTIIAALATSVALTAPASAQDQIGPRLNWTNCLIVDSVFRNIAYGLREGDITPGDAQFLFRYYMSQDGLEIADMMTAVAINAASNNTIEETAERGLRGCAGVPG